MPMREVYKNCRGPGNGERFAACPRSAFGPLNKRNYETNPVIMTVDEYETIRLIDWEGMTQEECAEKMNVAAQPSSASITMQEEAFRNFGTGKASRIEGGDYKLCDQDPQLYGCTRCYRHRHGRRL